MRILLVDHRDSYTQNLAHALGQITGQWPTIVDAHAIALSDLESFDAIVLSPGPGNVHTPSDVGQSLELLRRTALPVLGVCFGHQIIAHAAGARVVRSARPQHGHPVHVYHEGHPLFAEVPRDFWAMRYHSWCIEPDDSVQVLARSSEGEVMAIARGNQWGVQFHPESVATEHGPRILANFIAHARRLTQARVQPLPHAPFAPLGAFAALQANHERSFLLDGEFGDGVTYLGVLGDPVTEPFAALPPTQQAHPRFAFMSGRVGAFAYELEASRWFDVTGCIAYDHRTQEVFALASPPPSCVRAAEGPLNETADLVRSGPLLSDTNERDYLRNIDEIFALIRSGEVYQLCLTRGLHAKVAPAPLALYRRLRAVSPARHGAVLDFGDCALVGNSPETLLRLSAQGVAETRPIKGTRPRGSDAEADARLAAELRESAKDRAENLMIVDVARHDLGSVAKLGQVSTPDLLVVETLPTVLQLVSSVRAHVTKTAPEVARALLPPASMTGAPKQRAVAHLRHLEQRPRGFYAGAYGWMCDSGAASLAVTIRSATVTRNGAEGHCLSSGVGGAVLLDSDPASEWRESELKALALRRALA